MLLLLKTNDCLRHIDAALGVPINTAIVIGDTTAEVILKEDLHRVRGPGDFFKALWRYIRMKIRVSGLQFLSRFLNSVSLLVVKTFILPEFSTFLIASK